MKNTNVDKVNNYVSCRCCRSWSTNDAADSDPVWTTSSLKDSWNDKIHKCQQIHIWASCVRGVCRYACFVCWRVVVVFSTNAMYIKAKGIRVVTNSPCLSLGCAMFSTFTRCSGRGRQAIYTSSPSTPTPKPLGLLESLVAATRNPGDAQFFYVPSESVAERQSGSGEIVNFCIAHWLKE